MLNATLLIHHFYLLAQYLLMLFLSALTSDNPLARHLGRRQADSSNGSP